MARLRWHSNWFIFNVFIGLVHEACETEYSEANYKIILKNPNT